MRHVPAGLRGDEAALTRHNLGLLTRVNEGGRFYLTTSQLKGRQLVRVSIGSAPTQRRHVEALWEELRRQAEQT
jgi:aromatic-L-amino-acid decarboxylase